MWCGGGALNAERKALRRKGTHRAVFPEELKPLYRQGYYDFYPPVHLGFSCSCLPPSSSFPLSAFSNSTILYTFVVLICWALDLAYKRWVRHDSQGSLSCNWWGLVGWWQRSSNQQNRRHFPVPDPSGSRWLLASSLVLAFLILSSISVILYPLGILSFITAFSPK